MIHAVTVGFVPISKQSILLRVDVEERNDERQVSGRRGAATTRTAIAVNGTVRSILTLLALTIPSLLS